MKLSFLFTAAFLLYPCLLPAALPAGWQEAKSTHFIIYYKNAPTSFIDTVINNSEEYYNKIAESLGFTRYNFWLWDNRATIYIYDDQADYQNITGQPAWSAGSTEAKSKLIHTFPYAQGFINTILPHELGHIIFREFVGFDNYAVPLWLEEGVASYQEKIKFISIGTFANHKNFMNLETLSSFNPRLSQDRETVELFYAETASIIDYLIRQFGKDQFVVFCQNLRDKQNMDRALASVYPFSNTKELDLSWQKYLKR